MRQLRIGVIGLGVISRFYLRALEQIPSLRLAAVCDVDDAALAPFRDRVPCHRDHHEMLRQTDLDALVVTAPNDMHVTVCHDVLEAGLPCCVEKPLATRLEEGEALLECARTGRAPLFTAFHRRYNSAVLALVRRLPTDLPIESLTVRYLEHIEDHIGRDRWYLDPARCGGGCVADNGPNAYDLARLFLGEIELSDVVIHRDAQGIDRQARIVLCAASGAAVRVELDWSYDGECKDMEIRLADGSTESADMLPGYPGFKNSLWHEYVGILKAFERVILSGEPGDLHSVSDGGLAALALVDATYRAERLRSANSPSSTSTQP